MTSFMHYKWGSPMPLLFQCVMLPMNLADEPLVKIHVFGAKAEGNWRGPSRSRRTRWRTRWA